MLWFIEHQFNYSYIFSFSKDYEAIPPWSVFNSIISQKCIFYEDSVHLRFAVVSDLENFSPALDTANCLGWRLLHFQKQFEYIGW